jgi:hypothetical protein
MDLRFRLITYLCFTKKIGPQKGPFFYENEKTEIRNKPDSVLNYHSSRPEVTLKLQHPTRELLEQYQRSPIWACTS